MHKGAWSQGWRGQQQAEACVPQSCMRRRSAAIWGLVPTEVGGLQEDWQGGGTPSSRLGHSALLVPSSVASFLQESPPSLGQAPPSGSHIPRASPTLALTTVGCNCVGTGLSPPLTLSPETGGLGCLSHQCLQQCL